MRSGAFSRVDLRERRRLLVRRHALGDDGGAPFDVRPVDLRIVHRAPALGWPHVRRLQQSAVFVDFRHQHVGDERGHRVPALGVRGRVDRGQRATVGAGAEETPLLRVEGVDAVTRERGERRHLLVDAIGRLVGGHPRSLRLPARGLVDRVQRPIALGDVLQRGDRGVGRVPIALRRLVPLSVFGGPFSVVVHLALVVAREDRLHLLGGGSAFLAPFLQVHADLPMLIMCCA